MAQNTNQTKDSDLQKQRIDLDTTSSDLTGVSSLFEKALRRFRFIIPLILISLLYFIGCIGMGMSLVPGLYLINFVYSTTLSLSPFFHYFLLGVSIAIAYFLYGFTLILIIPFINFLLPLRLKPWRGIYYSLKTVPWFFHNALTYIVRYTFLNFITPTPFNVLFYRLMGMKIGKGVQINTTNISDPCLLELEDKVTIGGSATVVCHYGAEGFLILAPVKIRRGATIGLRCIIMGDVEIGEKAKILPNSVLMPKTRVPANEIWGGTPAQFIRKTKASTV